MYGKTRGGRIEGQTWRGEGVGMGIMEGTWLGGRSQCTCGGASQG